MCGLCCVREREEMYNRRSGPVNVTVAGISNSNARYNRRVQTQRGWYGHDVTGQVLLAALALPFQKHCTFPTG